MSRKLRVVPNENGTEQPGTESGTELSTEQIEEGVNRNQGRRDIGLFVNPPVEPGENSRFLRFALVAWDLPPIDISDPEQVRQRIGMYFQHCAENDRKPQIVGLANWIGIDRKTLNLWVNGEYRSATHLPIIKKAVSMIEEQWADYMQNGKINPASGIFLAKNWFNYKDVADVVVTPNNPLQDLNAQEAQKRIIDALPEADDE